jgi:hypothetical protein
MRSLTSADIVERMALPPQLSADARAAALEKAAEARRARAELKTRLKMGSLSLREVITQAESDPVIAKTKVLTVLESLPKLGKVKSRRVLEEVGIAESRRMQGLGDQQKAKLIELIEGA